MRIKLNLSQLIPDRNPSVYWLHVDDNILFIRQLKEKVKKVLKEFRELELCLDNVPFLDEDDIHAINENEEITVKVKKNNDFTEPNLFNSEADIKEPSISVNPSNSIYSTEPLDFNSDNVYESTISSILPKNSRKRVRKRTHKKKKQESESTVPIEGFSSTQPEILTSPDVPNKLHKRFKLENEENNQQEDISESSDDDCLQVTREVFVCDFNDSEDKKINIQPVLKKQTPLRTKVTKVPIFVRGQTVKNSIQTSESKSNISEDCDVLVVDWKNMTPLKISNLLDLQVSDIIQFKTLSMSECGEPALSSVITARLEHIYKTTLHIHVLSGIKEFMTVNEKFKLDEEDLGNQRQVEFNDLFEIFKLV